MVEASRQSDPKAIELIEDKIKGLQSAFNKEMDQLDQKSLQKLSKLSSVDESKSINDLNDQQELLTEIALAMSKDDSVVSTVTEFTKRNKTAFQKLDSKPREMDFTIKTEPFNW